MFHQSGGTPDFRKLRRYRGKCWIACLILLALAQGCATAGKKDIVPEETVPFKSEIKAVAIPAQAEVATDMTEMPRLSKPKAPPIKKDDDADKDADNKKARRSKKMARHKGHGRSPAGKSSHGIIRYIVREDDTLMKISFLIFGDVYRWREIYRDNKSRIPDPNSLQEGTVLKVHASGYAEIDQNGEPYYIKIGDTLVKISGKVYGTRSKWKRLWDNNRQLIHDPDKIYAGFYLYYVMTEKDRRELQRYRGIKLASTPLVKRKNGSRRHDRAEPDDTDTEDTGDTEAAQDDSQEVSAADSDEELASGAKAPPSGNSAKKLPPESEKNPAKTSEK